MTNGFGLVHRAVPARQKTHALLLALGALVLLIRTVVIMVEGAMTVLVAWVFVLLAAESALDATVLLCSLRWWRTGNVRHATFALRTGAAVALLHAARVLIFVLGRTGPWIDFDVRPEQRALHYQRWTWWEVYVASVLSVLGIVGVQVIWRYRRHHRKSESA